MKNRIKELEKQIADLTKEKQEREKYDFALELIAKSTIALTKEGLLTVSLCPDTHLPLYSNIDIDTLDKDTLLLAKASLAKLD